MREENLFKLGNLLVENVRVTTSNVTFRLTDTDKDKQELYILIQFSKEQLQSIYNFIVSSTEVEGGDINTFIMEYLYAIVCSAHDDSWLHMSSNSQLQMVTLGSHCIVSISCSENKHCITTSFAANGILDILEELKDIIES